jgi:hypothetical protein
MTANAAAAPADFDLRDVIDGAALLTSTANAVMQLARPVRAVVNAPGCYRPRYLIIQRLNYLWTIRHSSLRMAGNLGCRRRCMSCGGRYAMGSPEFEAYRSSQGPPPEQAA